MKISANLFCALSFLFLALFQSVDVANAQATPNVSGTWFDQSGRTLNCRQINDEVACTCVCNGEGAKTIITGRLSDTGEKYADGGTTVFVGEYSQPAVSVPKYRRGRVRFVFTYKWMGMEEDLRKRTPDYVGQSWVGQWWDANGVRGGVWNGSRVKDFEITSVSAPSRVKLNGPRGALRVSWSGKPTFPIRMVYAPDSCPPGINCTTPSRMFTAPANPLIFEGSVWCAGPPSKGLFFDYSVYLVDATGARTKPKKASFNCIP